MAHEKEHLFQYTEFWEARTGITFGVNRLLYSARSEFQDIQVMQTDAYGKLLTLDGLVMMTERDEFVYHEMITHPAMNLLASPRRVLVVGGGDGGTVREVLRYGEVEHVDLVEIDGDVIDVSREFFPSVSSALDDPRLTIHVRDGIEFVRMTDAASYDLVIIDSTDPVGIAEGLFGEEFYRDCARILNDGGIFVSQSESPFDATFQSTIANARDLLDRLFGRTFVYLAHIPTYPTGTWSFTLTTKGLHPIDDFNPARVVERTGEFAAELKYYNAAVHLGAFALPNFARQ
ncbi:MAG: polyamine aminopropyltransferase [Rhodothermales bacterium]